MIVIIWILIAIGSACLLAKAARWMAACFAIACVMFIVDSCWIAVTGQPSFMTDPELVRQSKIEDQERDDKAKAKRIALAIKNMGVTKIRVSSNNYHYYRRALHWARLQVSLFGEERLKEIASKNSITDEQVECCLKAAEDFDIENVYDGCWGAVWCKALETASR